MDQSPYAILTTTAPFLNGERSSPFPAAKPAQVPSASGRVISQTEGGKGKVTGDARIDSRTGNRSKSLIPN